MSEDQNKPFPPTPPVGLLGPGFQRRTNPPTPSTPTGGLLSGHMPVSPPVVEPEPPAVSIEARIDARLADALDAIGYSDDDDSDPILH